MELGTDGMRNAIQTTGKALHCHFQLFNLHSSILLLFVIPVNKHGIFGEGSSEMDVCIFSSSGKTAF